MANPVTNEYYPDYVSPPGETLREILEERGVSQAELAIRTGRPKKTISEIVNGKAAITPETALQLELVLGIPAEFWNAREQHYREYLARLEQTRDLERGARWIVKFPIRVMQRLGWIQEQDTTAEMVREFLQFFGVVSPEQWEEVMSRQQVSFRKSAAFESDRYAISAWLREGVRKANEIACSPFDKSAFLHTLGYARSLTREMPEVFCEELVGACAEAGVAVAFVPELPQSRAHGATRWLSPNKALIQLSLRYKTDDHLWFTFFHEAAHILLHGKRLIFIEGTEGSGNDEEEANRFAADFLIPPHQYEKLHSKTRFSKDFIKEFAASIGIAPGIVVGRLQHDGLLPHTHCNGLKQRFRWV